MGLEIRPGERLTTQNLVLSADAALHGDGQVHWTSVRDLATLIDLFSMSDQASVLGRPLGTAFESPLGDLLVQSQFLRVEVPTSNALLLNSARQHLFTLLNSPPSATFDDLLVDGLQPSPTFSYAVASPDLAGDYAAGEAWMKAAARSPNAFSRLRDEPHMARQASLVARSFLYIAFSELTGRPFVPDAVRREPILRIAQAEQELRSLILNAIKEGASRRTVADTELFERVSPFATIVFARAKGDRRRIIDEMDLLRFELRTTRARLRDAESQIFFGRGAQVAKAQNEWKAIASELSRSYGREPGLVTMQHVIGWGREAGELLTDPENPKSWMQLLLSQPADVLARIANRRRAVELHRLQAELPGEGSVRRSLKTLFGNVQT